MPSTGVHHYLWNQGKGQSRIHLRIDPDGSGVLMVNANRIFHLNPSAASMAFYSLEKVPSSRAVQALSRNFDIPKTALAQDLESFGQNFTSLLNDDACPVCDLDLEVTTPFSARLTAPYRMDLALTYRCNNACAHCYNDRPRNYPELSTQEWFKILDRLWEIGIPHIVFTGGEPTLREDFPELIRHAEKNGQITGLNTNGRKLKDTEYVQQLVDAGLDHVQITFESSDPKVHDLMVCHPGAWPETLAGIKNALASKLYVMTNTTMLTTNVSTIPSTLEFLADMGMPTVGLNALIYSGRGKNVGTGLSEAQLYPLLESAKSITSKYNQRLIWYTPTQYCNFDPVQMELGVKGCTAALYNMCIEPDGSVLPCQSYYTPVGNILKHKWTDIWDHELCMTLRDRKRVPAKCNDCLLLTDCGGGCPLLFESIEDGGKNESQA